MVDIGGRTGLFTLTNDKLLEGTVPTGLKLSVSGDTSNVGAGTFKVFPHAVSLFTSNYPEQYPSDINFTPGIGAPSVTKVVPETGFGGDLITVEGQDLYGLTGVSFYFLTSRNNVRVTVHYYGCSRKICFFHASCCDLSGHWSVVGSGYVGIFWVPWGGSC